MAKFKKAPDSEWLGYPYLEVEDVEHDFFKHSPFLAESLAKNRRGRVILVMDHDVYRRFLDAVNKMYGNINASSVNEAALKAVEKWVQEVEE
ncbi:MAG: hypothetical protein PVF58_01725 [Candidatus Methanofastidiosia archaeon]|jgi:hypothetical protein